MNIIIINIEIININQNKIFFSYLDERTEHVLALNQSIIDLNNILFYFYVISIAVVFTFKYVYAVPRY